MGVTACLLQNCIYTVTNIYTCLSCMCNYMVVKVVIFHGFRSHGITIHSCLLNHSHMGVTACLIHVLVALII